MSLIKKIKVEMKVLMTNKKKKLNMWNLQLKKKLSYEKLVKKKIFDFFNFILCFNNFYL